VATRKSVETRKSRKARTVPHQATYDTFLERLIAAREELGLSQREVSERMEMAHSFLSKCETGERRVDVIEFLVLAKLYGKPLEFFLNSADIGVLQAKGTE
jgi:transcriptional regulator with XRE-family HTH domain